MAKLEVLKMEKLNVVSMENVHGGLNWGAAIGVKLKDLNPDYDTGCDDAPDCYTGANQEDTEAAL